MPQSNRHDGRDPPAPIRLSTVILRIPMRSSRVFHKLSRCSVSIGCTILDVVLNGHSILLNTRRVNCLQHMGMRRMAGERSGSQALPCHRRGLLWRVL
jgi:hypothetical protein